MPVWGKTVDTKMLLRFHEAPAPPASEPEGPSQVGRSEVERFSTQGGSYFTNPPVFSSSFLCCVCVCHQSVLCRRLPGIRHWRGRPRPPPLSRPTEKAAGSSTPLRLRASLLRLPRQAWPACVPLSPAGQHPSIHATALHASSASSNHPLFPRPPAQVLSFQPLSFPELAGLSLPGSHSPLVPRTFLSSSSSSSFRPHPSASPTSPSSRPAINLRFLAQLPAAASSFASSAAPSPA